MVVPTFVWLFFKLITPFIDPTTREKLKFNEDLRQYVPPEQLYDLFGGDYVFEYDHDAFYPEFVKLALERRDRFFAKWKAAGGGIGQSELDVRTDGTEEAVKDTPVETVTTSVAEEPKETPAANDAPAVNETPAETAGGVTNGAAEEQPKEAPTETATPEEPTETPTEKVEAVTNSVENNA
jgi:hypothetical protein